jgi:hypothetical protein
MIRVAELIIGAGPQQEPRIIRPVGAKASGHLSRAMEAAA